MTKINTSNPNAKHAVIINTATHAYSRIRHRVGLKSKEDVKKFLKKVVKYGLPFSKIPKNVPEFHSFLGYLRRIKNKKDNQKYLNTRIFIYKEYIFILYLDGYITTVLNTDKEFKGMYDKIIKYINSKKEDEI